MKKAMKNDTKVMDISSHDEAKWYFGGLRLRSNSSRSLRFGYKLGLLLPTRLHNLQCLLNFAH